MQAIDGSLERFGLDFVDLLFCHRADPNTPIEETVWAMSDIVASGQGALLGHVGVDGRRDPRRVGDRRPPPPAQAGDGAAAVQPARAPHRVEREYARLYDDIGLGLTTWSPLASGLLPGKYLDGIPDGQPRHAPRLRVAARHAHRRRQQRRRCGSSQASPTSSTAPLSQLALAWCAKNPHVSTVITGASRVEQVHENLGALDVLPQLADDVMARINDAVGWVGVDM